MTDTHDLSERVKAYDRMAKALDYLGDTWQNWPNLSECAAHIGLSPSHFQREFSRWAGLSPHQYQSVLAHGAAGDLLRGGASVLEASYEIGLSGPSRLHDLFIAHEGLSPGETKSQGKNLPLKIGRAATPFGPGVWLVSDRGLVALGFIDAGAPERTGFVHKGREESDAFADIAGRYPQADIQRDDAEAVKWAARVFESQEALPVALYGTPFRRQVWRALMNIPAGQTKTYGEIAGSIGRPKAARATGTAIGANPLSWLIPCHRAISADRRLHNYHWGLTRKRAMLAYEWAHTAS